MPEPVPFAAIREALGITQQHLAQLFHLSYSTVSRMERGAGSPDESKCLMYVIVGRSLDQGVPPDRLLDRLSSCRSLADAVSSVLLLSFELDRQTVRTADTRDTRPSSPEPPRPARTH